MTYPKKQAEAQMIFRKTGGFVQGNMTLRDHFAGLAMQAILMAKYPITKDPDAEHKIAKAAYQGADAMLKAREA